MIKAKDKEKYLAAIRRFKLFDDTFMSVVFDNHIEATQCILRIILNNSALSVVSVKTQDVLTNLHGKSIRLDITAIDSNGIIYNIEIQKDEAGAKTKRARYNSSMLDASSLQPGEDWEMLPESYVIIFTETDFFKKKHPIYHIERVIIEDDKSLFDDKEHIIYVNGSYKGSDDIGMLVHDFWCSNPDEMYLEPLRERVKHFKEAKEGQIHMCRIMDELKDEGRAEGRAEEKAVSIQNAIELLKIAKPDSSKAEIVKLVTKTFDTTKKEVEKYL